MTHRLLAPLALMMLLAACSGNSLNNGPEDPDTDTGTDNGGIDSDRELPPGTASPSRNGKIVRYEARADDTGNGYAEDFSYDRDSDTFSVDNLGFDGDNAYQRGTAVGSLGPFAVYEGDQVFEDDRTGTPITQFTHRAIYGVSRSGQTEFALVRSGSYIGYGFGGFVYQRNDRDRAGNPVSVTLPTSGQATYQGNYAALRDFNGTSGIEYATGDVDMAIDFNDFNDGYAVRGFVRNRAIFDANGNDITSTVLTALTEDTGRTQTALPTLVFSVGPSALDVNGEILGTLGSQIATDTGAQAFEEGNYYAIVSGADAEEIVGVIVVEADDPRFDSVTVRETGGFIVYRPDAP